MSSDLADYEFLAIGKAGFSFVHFAGGDVKGVGGGVQGTDNGALVP